MGMNAWLTGLQARVDERLATLGETEALTFESEGSLEIPVLLRIALKNELEAVEVAGAWLATTPPDTPHAHALKLALARQAGDEARHHALIAQRLAALDVDVKDWDPFKDQPRSPLTTWLMGLADPVERMAAGPFAREALACTRNAQFIALCRVRGDTTTAALYERRIQPDELHHHRMGADFLARLATDEPARARAAAAVERTLSLADELGARARAKGAAAAPGC